MKKINFISKNIRKNIECTGMENMRSEFVTLCEQNEISIEKTCIKQSKSDLNKGVIVAMKDNETVASVYWNRSIKEEDGKRYYYLLCTRSINRNAGNPLFDFSEYADEDEQPKPAKQRKEKASKGKEQTETTPAEPATTEEPKEEAEA